MFSQMGNIVESLDYKPVYMCVYGSQNYEMDIFSNEYASDFDYKAIIVPKLRDLAFDSKPISKVVDIENGQVDLKDIRLFFSILKKCNPAFVECFLTENWIGDPEFENARKLMPDLVWELRESFIKACYGMMLEKYKALQHPYPSVVERLEKFGYDPKQLHHMLRLYKMMQDFDKTGKVILVPDNKNYLINVKLGYYSVEDAIQVAKKCKSDAEYLKNEMIAEYLEQSHTYDAVQEMENFALIYIEKKVREEVLRG